MDQITATHDNNCIVNETIRWKVVKMAHKMKNDMAVAKMLLDCYDVIISGCLQWENNTKKKRIPHCTSNKGWQLLEEIDYMMRWKHRQDAKKQILTVWIDDEKDDDQGEDKCGDDDHELDGRESHTYDNDVDDNGDDVSGVDDWQEDSLTKEHVSSESATIPQVATTRGLDKQAPLKNCVKRIKYTSKGKTCRPTKAIEILNTHQTKVIECKRCFERFTLVEDFIKHFQCHSKAVIIGKKVQRVSDMKVEDVPFVATILIPCKDCNELTDNHESHQLNKHFRRICNLCGNCFLSFGGWSRHMKTHRAKETGVKPHVCDKCGKAFALVGTLTMHSKLHSSERVHTCDVCGKGFKLRTGLMRHMSVHSDKSVTCNICSKSFNYKFNLKTHLRTHTGERPFSCTTCGKSYSHNSSLKAHAKSEHGIDMENGWQTLIEFGEAPEDYTNKDFLQD